MFDYGFHPETPGYDEDKLEQLVFALEHMLIMEFPDAPSQVKAVDYPRGSVRLINLEHLDKDAIESLTVRADEIYKSIMDVP